MCAARARTENASRNGDRDLVAGLANGLRAIEAFSSHHKLMTVADVARQTGLTRAATRRYLLTLTASGYAAFDGKRFQLTSRVLRLGHAYISSVPLPQIAQPIVEELGHKTEESIAFSVLEGSESLTIASSAPRRIVGIFTRVGTHLPALSTSTGRVVLADKSDEAIEQLLRFTTIEKLTYKTKNTPTEIWDEIRRIRKMGYGLNDEEVEVGLRVIAVPVRNSAGAVVAALCVSTYAGRYKIDQLKRKFLDDLLEASERLRRLL
jgi:IclR family transcriptional regulator, pca regulon regulatory protein